MKKNMLFVDTLTQNFLKNLDEHLANKTPKEIADALVLAYTKVTSYLQGREAPPEVLHTIVEEVAKIHASPIPSFDLH
jgi:hypothetical protein